ncbi:MAG: nucleotidyltransferase family protein [Acidobacteria bacterium]|nr:nucleotidyltransferase family protein [Acidobacteriota bacterium]
MENLLDTSSSEYQFVLLEKKGFELKISEFVALLGFHSIPSLLFKGWLAASNYPETHYRQYSDIDLAVAPEDYDQAVALIREAKPRGIAVDIHKGFRHLDTLSWEEIFSRSQTITLNNTEVHVPCPEDHLRIMCVHWLTDGGEYKHRLWDIYYAVTNRPVDFDWDKCLSPVSPVRQEWVITCIALAHRYLDLEIDDLPFAERAKDLPEWLTERLEYEWENRVPLRPLRIVYRDPALLIQQLKKRFPPNPIYSTVDMEGSFASRTRFFYHLGSMLKRSRNTVRDIFNIVRHRPSRKS